MLYSVEIDPGAGSGSYQTNTADVDWSSLPGTPANSRRYDDGPEESGWTADTDTETIQIQIPDLLKSVESGDTTRTIGESFYYQIDFSVPASTTAYNIFIDDLVPNGLSVTGTQIVNGPATTVTVGPRNVLGQTPVVWDVGDVTNPPDEVLTCASSPAWMRPMPSPASPSTGSSRRTRSPTAHASRGTMLTQAGRPARARTARP